MDALTISRNWHEPTIQHTVNLESIGLTISLEDFVRALKEELGSPTMIITKAQLSIRMDAAIARVISKIKEESIKTPLSLPTDSETST